MGTFLSKKTFLLLITVCIYSCSGIFSKLASQQEFLSLQYILFLSCVVAVLGIYAVLWQKVLSFMPLNKAFLCKSITIVIVLAFSALIFSEEITANNIIGAIFIIFGLIVLAWKE